MKIITLNLNGIRSAARKGLYPWLESQNADFVCLQELKAQAKDLADDIRAPKNYLGYFSYAIKKGYSGVGIYSRLKPNKVTTILDIPEIDDEGRYIELEFDSLIIISVYLPSGSSGDERQAFKYKVLEKIIKIFELKIKQGKNIIVCGDFNIAHHEIDLKNYKGNRKNSGFLPAERAWLTNLFDNVGYNDVYRNLYPEHSDEAYTWWSNRGQAWLKNVGWRIDYQIANSSFAAKALTGDIYKEARFSDHAPLIINYSD